MDVRLVRPTDVPFALTLVLDERAHLVRSIETPVSTALLRTLVRSMVPVALPGRAWIARDGSSAALLEAVPRRYVIGWDVTRLVVHGDPDMVVPGVVEAAASHLRTRGIPRLFARCAETPSDELRAVGFAPLAREYLLIGSSDHTIADAPLPDDSRYRMPQDAWPLHQLESETTPPLVRQLEGLTSVDWSNKLREMAEIVVERDGKIVCWIGWGLPLGNGLRQIGMLVHPCHADVAHDLLRHVLSRSRGQRFLARVREYHPEVLTTFTEAGFSSTREEVLMVKHGGVEPARVPKGIMQVVQMPTAQIAHNQWSAAAPTPPGDAAR